jgi:hypothetical protein
LQLLFPDRQHFTIPVKVRFTPSAQDSIPAPGQTEGTRDAGVLGAAARLPGHAQGGLDCHRGGAGRDGEQRYRRFLGPYLRAATKEEFEVVALMREPLDWLASWYRFRRREELTDTTRTTRGLGFDRFVQDYLSEPRPAHADVGSQARFLTLPGGELGVDRLFAYERIDRFVAFLEDRLDCEIILPTLNVSPEAELDISSETIARHRAATAADYTLWESLTDG